MLWLQCGEWIGQGQDHRQGDQVGGFAVIQRRDTDGMEQSGRSGLIREQFGNNMVELLELVVAWIWSGGKWEIKALLAEGGNAC